MCGSRRESLQCPAQGRPVLLIDPLVRSPVSPLPALCSFNFKKVSQSINIFSAMPQCHCVVWKAVSTSQIVALPQCDRQIRSLCACTHTHTLTIYAGIHAHTHAHTNAQYTYACTHVHAHVHTYTCRHEHMHICMCAHQQFTPAMHTCAHVHTHIPICMHAYTQVDIEMQSPVGISFLGGHLESTHPVVGSQGVFLRGCAGLKDLDESDPSRAQDQQDDTKHLGNAGRLNGGVAPSTDMTGP